MLTVIFMINNFINILNFCISFSLTYLFLSEFGFKKLEQLGNSVNKNHKSITDRILKDNLEAFKKLAK